MNRTALTCTALASLAVASHGVLTAGPLTPPGGPVASTYKTLAEVEPRTAVNAANTPGNVGSLYIISQPGSYYLPGNLDGVAGKHVIQIAASNVTLDLMGFRILGGGSLDGINVSGNQSNITIRNGSVRTCGGHGINAASAATLRIADVTARNNTGDGILTGPDAAITSCIAQANSGNGINAGENTVLTGCTARDNGGVGLDTDNSSVITSCTSMGNTGDGFSTGATAMVSQCTAYTNGGVGFNLNNGSMLRDCVSRSSGGNGVQLTNDSTVTGCTITESGNHGVLAIARCVIADNTISRAAATSSTQRGILVTGSDGRVEHNQVTLFGSGYGVDLAGSRNVYIRNIHLGSAWHANPSVTDDYCGWSATIDALNPVDPSPFANLVD